ncbi:MAG TPA: hypothetical protein VD927_14035 [Chryseosolibacter sp.]|nr:hypothetical protein [Chryseosolibacter sp.]
MKKIILLFTFVASALISFGQSATADPAGFTADDEVTITINTTGTGLDGYTGDVYVWTWAIRTNGLPNLDAPTNSNPAGAGQAAAKMTRSETNPNIYTITFTPSEFYGVPAVQFDKIGILAKGADWSNGQTADFVIEVEPPVFESPVIRIFPTEFSADDVVTIFYDTKLEENAEMKAVGEYYLLTSIGGTNGEDDLDPNDYYKPIGEETKLMAVGNGVFRISFVPSRFFDLAEGDVIGQLLYLIQNQSGTLTNPPAGFEILKKDVRVKAN